MDNNNLFYIASVHITCAPNRCTWSKKHLRRKHNKTRDKTRQ